MNLKVKTSYNQQPEVSIEPEKVPEKQPQPEIIHEEKKPKEKPQLIEQEEIK